MRGVRLGKVAAQAEILRLRQLASRTAARLLLGIIACVFLIAALVDGHIALGLWLAPRLGALHAVLVVAAGDLALGVLLMLIAALKGPGRIEREALEVREIAWLQLKEGLTMAAMVTAIARRIGMSNISAVLRFLGRALGGRR